MSIKNVIRGSEPLTPVQASLNEAAFSTLGLTLDAMTAAGREAYNQRSRRDWGTFNHETRVGGLLWLTTGNAEVALAGTLHDTGKGRDEIQELMEIERFFTPTERQRMARHAAYGAEDLRSAIADPAAESLARQVAANHHTLRPTFFLNSRVRYGADVTSLVQVADRADAMLIDWGDADDAGRLSYKADRMSREGLIDDAGQVVMDKMLESVLGADAQARYLGVSASSIVELAVECMPSAALIQQGVQIARQARAA